MSGTGMLTTERIRDLFGTLNPEWLTEMCGAMRSPLSRSRCSGRAETDQGSRNTTAPVGVNTYTRFIQMTVITLDQTRMQRERQVANALASAGMEGLE